MGPFAISLKLPSLTDKYFVGAHKGNFELILSCGHDDMF